MPRYVIANRRAGKFSAEAKRRSRERVDSALVRMAHDVSIINNFAIDDDLSRRVAVIEAEVDFIASLKDDLSSDTIIEPEILHKMAPSFPASLLNKPESLGKGEAFWLRITSSNLPLVFAEVTLFLRQVTGRTASALAITDQEGIARFEYAKIWTPAAVLVAPVGGHWYMALRKPENGQRVECASLPFGDLLGWWHRAVGVNEWDAARGSGVKVGVVDSGIGAHTCLSHVNNVGAFVKGNHDPLGGGDVYIHGTHVCGVIAGRPPVGSSSFGGVAPGVTLYSARVFPPDVNDASQADIVNAIDHLSKKIGADLINLSLSTPTPSLIEHDTIVDALERGTLCICAAANSSGPVEYPAAFPECIAVSAIGLLGFAPSDSLSGKRIPEEPALFGADQLFLANFSCFGDQIAACGPGVAIISTVPSRHGYVDPFAPMDGTSAASPIVCAALAARLSKDAEYQKLPRERHRADVARSALRSTCRDVGLKPVYQGLGLPQVNDIGSS
jgi:subtilisin family serine protease